MTHSWTRSPACEEHLLNGAVLGVSDHHIISSSFRDADELPRHDEDLRQLMSTPEDTTQDFSVFLSKIEEDQVSEGEIVSFLSSDDEDESSLSEVSEGEIIFLHLSDSEEEDHVSEGEIVSLLSSDDEDDDSDLSLNSSDGDVSSDDSDYNILSDEDEEDLEDEEEINHLLQIRPMLTSSPAAGG